MKVQGGGGVGGRNMSTLMQILNLYATRDSQIKFEGNRRKNAKFHIFTCTIYSIQSVRILPNGRISY